jgi:hypothetical protein
VSRLVGRAGPSLVTSARAAVLPWLAGRAITLGSLALARFLVTELTPTGAIGRRATGTAHAGLMSWDAAWYRRIAEIGYAKSGTSSLRFFPLLPLLARGLSDLGVSLGTALLVIANVCGFAALVLLHRLVSGESLGTGVADRSLWILSLWPAAFVLTMGYAEALFLLLSIAAFLAWRRERWWWSIVPAFLAGACRPVGVLLAVPALVEAWRWWHGGGRLRLEPVAARLAGILAAPAGAAIYLGWVASQRGGSFLEPYRVQLGGGHRGSLSDPLVTLWHDGVDLAHGQHVGTGLHAPFVVIFLLLSVYLLVRMPTSYGWYAVVTMAVAVTAHNLDGFERYGLACFPLAVGAALVMRPTWLERTVFAGMGAVLAGLGVLAFLGLYVP